MTQKSMSENRSSETSSVATSSDPSANKSGNTNQGRGATGQSDIAVSQLRDGLASGARELSTEVKHVASDVAGEAKKAAESKLDAGKDFAAEHLGSVADALRKTSKELRSSESAVTDYVDMAASSVEKVSGYLQTRTLSQLMGDAESFARREPAVFLGGAFFLGMLGGRFLKSASPARPQATGANRGPSQRSFAQPSSQGVSPGARPAYGELPAYGASFSSAGGATSGPSSSRSDSSSYGPSSSGASNSQPAASSGGAAKVQGGSGAGGTSVPKPGQENGANRPNKSSGAS